MPRKRISVEQIINMMRDADVLLAQGQTVLEVCRGFGAELLPLASGVRRPIPDHALPGLPAGRCRGAAL